MESNTLKTLSSDRKCIEEKFWVYIIESVIQQQSIKRYQEGKIQSLTIEVSCLGPRTSIKKNCNWN